MVEQSAPQPLRWYPLVSQSGAHSACKRQPGVSDAELWVAMQEKQAEGGTATGDDVDNLKTPEWLVFIDPAHAQRTRRLSTA